MSEAKTTIIDGINNGEDFAPILGTPWLLTSGTTRSGRRGGFYVVDIRDRSYRRIWPGQEIDRDSRYGDCEAPVSEANFMSHGLDLSEVGPGLHRLYAVNHAERESIEIFDVRADLGSISFAWAGAVILPEDNKGNAVAAFPDGRMLVTMSSLVSDSGFRDRMLRGEPTGYVLQWDPEGGWSRLPGSEGSLPNGIALSADGRTAVTAYTGGRSAVVRDLTGTERGKEIDLGFGPDNVRRDENGNFRLAGNSDWEDHTPAVVMIDGASFQVTRINLPNLNGFKCSSTALPLNGELWIGSYDSTQIAVVSGFQL